jgi:hemerythrin
MPKIDPAQIPQFPIAFMNADHAREVRLLNDLGAALDAHSRGEGTLAVVIERLSLLAVHTREHFLREESMMREAGFPAYPQHKAEHDQALARMDVEARVFREHGDAARLSSYLFETLPAWYLNHQRTMDMITSRFSAERRPPA